MRTAVHLSPLVGLVAACGAPGPEDWPAGRPRIERLRFLDQKPQSPLDLLFAVDFLDADGDLGAGQVELMVEGAATSRLALSDVFEAQFPPLARTATAGAFEVYVRLGDEVRIGDRMKVELVLEDARGHRSNRPSVTLEATGDDGRSGT